MKWYISTRARLGIALGIATIASAGLWAVGALYNHSLDYLYLLWNLLLAWVPLILMVQLEKTLRRKLWSSWQALLTTGLFVAFLPNAFYVATDVIHLYEQPRADIVYDVIMLTSFTMNAFLLGFIGLHMFHVELRKRLGATKSWALVAVLALVVSFAIYIGRDLRWNTWDLLLNPASILFEVSDRLLAPFDHPELFSMTLGFFVLIMSVYLVLWYMARALRQQKLPD